MPWADEPRGQEFYDTVEEVVDGILKYNAKSLKILQGISQGDVTIPKSMTLADDEKREKEKIKYVASQERVRLKVNIYYMVGNHDWFFYIPDKQMDPIRNKVIDTLGLANPKNTPFPFHRDEYKPLLDVQEIHRVFAEHGDQFDPVNYRAPRRDRSSEGDVVVIRLLNAIPKGVELYLEKIPGIATHKKEVDLFIKLLYEIDNLRPYALAPAWITQAIKQSGLHPEIADKALGEALRILALKYLNNKLVTKAWYIQLFIFLVNTKWLWQYFNIQLLAMLLRNSRWTRNTPESYKKFAIEQASKQEKDFFLMGHTHYAEIVPICNYKENDVTRSKIYLNTGTWRAVHLLADNEKDFISFKSMTIAGFYKDDERKGRSFEFWTGSLAL